MSLLSVPTKVHIDVAAFVSYVVPPVVCYFVLAVLALSPETRAIRLAFWPVVALLAWRAAVSVDMSLSKPVRGFLDMNLVVSMFCLATRTLEWSLAKEPLVRHVRLVNGSGSAIMNAVDLVFNFRGHGWEWSHEMHIPREIRPANCIAFIFCTLLSAAAHALLFGVLHRAALSFALVGAGSVLEGSTIFDDTLPFYLRYFRSSIITTFTTYIIYAFLQMSYDLCTIPAVLFFGQDTTQWPPAFDAPWFATSLSDFWSYRWHQFFRRIFLFLGGDPLSLVLGRRGRVFGGFMASAVFHHVAILSLNGRAEFWRMFVGFGMLALGVLAEREFRRRTGQKVGGVAGWVWMTMHVLLCGNVIVEGFARAGVFSCSTFFDSVLPMRVLVERQVNDFDTWLHTI